MQHLEASAQRAVSALARADWQALEHTSRQIAGSFILAQRLSAEQRAELHRVLPPAFLGLDGAFHLHAEKLAAAAGARDAELAAFYTYPLLDGCASCHAQYARQRFQAAGGGPAPGSEPHAH